MSAMRIVMPEILPAIVLRASSASSASISLLRLPATTRSLFFLAALCPLSYLASATSPQTTASLKPYSTMTSTESESDDHDHPRRSGTGGGQAMLARHRQKSQDNSTHPSDTQRSQQRGYFPLGYKAGFSQWWASLAPAATENTVLSFIPYLQRPPTHTQTGSAPVSAKASSTSVDKGEEGGKITTTSSITDPYGPRRWHSTLVHLAGKNRYLNEFSVERLGEDPDNALVMLHGYGAGLGFFYKNFEALSRQPNWKLYALDLLGMGRSSRPPFRIKSKDKEAKVREAESWFVDALEEWRIKRGIDRFTLLGHSLGGYMAVCYALKYPGHLNKLILASPVGIPEDPYAVNADMPEPEESTMGNEFTQSQDDTTTSSGDQNNFLNAKKNAPASTTAGQPPRKPLPKWLTTLWDANLSPFSLVRWSGPLGPRLVSGWTSRRFAHLPPHEAQALHDYSYSLFRQRGSGEYALGYVLAPGAFARSPLIRRIHGVGRQYMGPHAGPTVDDASSSATAPSTLDGGAAVQRVRETGIPVVLMYGENDWMDIAGGYAAEERLNAERSKALANATPAETARENGQVKVTVVRKAGHHVYLDSAEQFNSEVVGEMRDVEARERRLAELER